jgi:hypothetical protein
MCVNWVNNHDIHQSLKVVFSDEDIHSSLDVAKEKVWNLPLKMCSIIQNNSYDSILKCIVGCCTFNPIRALKKMGT